MRFVMMYKNDQEIIAKRMRLRPADWTAKQHASADGIPVTLTESILTRFDIPHRPPIQRQTFSWAGKLPEMTLEVREKALRIAKKELQVAIRAAKREASTAPPYKSGSLVW